MFRWGELPSAITYYISKHIESHHPAVSWLGSTLKIDPAYDLALKRLAPVYQELGDMKNACRVYRLYLQIEPNGVLEGFDGCAEE